MATINLRELYPVKIIENEKVKNPDCFIEVSDSEAEAFKASLTEEIADMYFDAQRDETAYQRRLYRNNAHYSLDCDDGIESDAISITVDPLFEAYADKLTQEQLYTAIASLPEKQSKRIYAHYILGLSKAAIARMEGVNESKVRIAIERGLEKIKKSQKNFFE